MISKEQYKEEIDLVLNFMQKLGFINNAKESRLRFLHNALNEYYDDIKTMTTNENRTFVCPYGDSTKIENKIAYATRTMRQVYMAKKVGDIFTVARIK